MRDLIEKLADAEQGLYCPACNRLVVFKADARVVIHEGNGPDGEICSGSPIVLRDFDEVLAKVESMECKQVQN